MTKLFVPEIKWAYDTADISVSVTLPASVLSQAIPDLPRRMRGYNFVLHLVPPWQNIAEKMKSRVQDILERRGKWTDPHWQVIPSTHLFRIHNGEFEAMYDVVRITPKSPTVSLSGDDWVAGCVSIAGGRQSMCLTQFTIENVSVDLYLSEVELPFRDQIRKAVGQEIASWTEAYSRQ